MNIFAAIKSRVSILDVVQEYTSLKKAGNYWKGQCPFHHERTASFTVSPHKEIFYCFGCHQGGDVIMFISKLENCSQVEAARHIAERYAIELPEQLPVTHTHEKELYTLAHQTVATWCAENLKKSAKAQDYLTRRGITQDSIERFSIGYFPGGQQALKSLLRVGKEKNILLQDFIQANILRNSERDTIYSPYEERITFPITDALGRACGLGGRIFSPDDTRAKYYNSQDHPYFSKGTILYGFFQAKKAMQESAIAYLVEGYLDCIAFSQAGLGQTIATLGTACTAEHMKLLSRYIEKLYTVYDGDAAGQKATLRLTQLCWDVDLEPYVIQLPPGEDPCSLVAKGYLVQELTKHGVNIFEYFIKKTAGSSTQLSLQERMARVNAIIELIGQVQDPVRQDFLLQKAAEACQLPYETIKKSLLKRVQPVRAARESSPILPDPVPEKMRGDNSQIEMSELEKKIFSAIISKKYVLSPEERSFLKLAFSPYLFSIIERLHDEAGNLGTISITDVCNESERAFVASVLMEDEVKGEGPSLDELFLQFYQKQWKMIVNSVKIKIAQAQKMNRNEELERIINHFQSLKRKLFGKE